MTLLSVSDLNVRFRIGKDIFHAVKDFGINVGDNERIAIVGESGSGKSVIASAIFGILERNASYNGTILFDGNDLSSLSHKEFDGLRSKEMVLIPQNVSQAWDPLMRIGPQMTEFIISAGYTKQEAVDRARQFLSKCGFEDPDYIMGSYPHRLSGGMSQRAMIAMCMSVGPRLVIADEPTKGLDEEVCENVLELLLSGEWNTSILMITHDLNTASRCDRMMVMYGGRCVESGVTREILENPMHPYTVGLLESHPSRGLKPIPFGTRAVGPEECSFANRCVHACPECTNQCFTYGNREVRCHRIGDV